MLVPNQFVKVKWNNSNKKWYESKGYVYTKMNDEFEVKVEDLSLGSQIRVQISCDKCGNIYTLAYSNYVKNYINKNKPDICAECIEKEIKERNTTLCSYCGKTIFKKYSEIKKHKHHFCDMDCRSKYFTGENNVNYNRVEVQCGYCGKKLLIKKYVYDELVSGKRSNVFCDRTCQAKWMSENNKGENNPLYKGRIKKICLYCEKEYYIEPHRKNRNKYCSKECQMKHLNVNKKRISTNCGYCGKEMTTTPSKLKNSKSGKVFCSIKCVGKYNSMIRKKRVSKICLVCGTNYEVIPSQAEKSVTCSIECQHIWQSKFLVGENAVGYKHEIPKSERIVKCSWCGKDVEVRPYELKQIKEGNKQKFCSKKCKKEWYAKVWSQSEEWKEESRKRAVQILTEGKIEKVNTGCQLIVNNILDELKINYINEYDCEYVTIDNYLPDYNLMIEVMGTYWHVDPRVYEKIHYQIQYDRVINDKRKKSLIKNQYGIDILYLWEDDILNNPELCKKLILEYISNNGNLNNYHSFNYSLINNELIHENKHKAFMDYEAEELQDLFEIKSGEKRSFKQEDKWITFNCENCGKETEQLKSRYRKAIHHFCSTKCAHEFRRGKTLEEIRNK